jgi:hypothetical protein
LFNANLHFGKYQFYFGFNNIITLFYEEPPWKMQVFLNLREEYILTIFEKRELRTYDRGNNRRLEKTAQREDS